MDSKESIFFVLLFFLIQTSSNLSLQFPPSQSARCTYSSFVITLSCIPIGLRKTNYDGLVQYGIAYVDTQICVYVHKNVTVCYSSSRDSNVVHTCMHACMQFDRTKSVEDARGSSMPLPSRQAISPWRIWISMTNRFGIRIRRANSLLQDEWGTTVSVQMLSSRYQDI